MKKKLLLLLTVVCSFCCTMLAACGSKSSTKANEFIRVTDGVFASAGYTSSSNTASASVSAKAMAVAVDASGAKSGITTEITEMYDAIKTDSNVGILDDYNLNYIKGDTLYQGANLAGLFKSMAYVLGDDMFSNIYDLTKVGMENTVAKLVEGDYYTLYGVVRSGKTIESAIQIDFKEYGNGKFIFKLVQYDKLNDVSEIHFSYYDSESVAFIATLQGDIGLDFTAYDQDYQSYMVKECRIAIFGHEDYISERNNGTVHDETILKFAKESLNYSNQTYIDLAEIANGKSLSNKEANEIGSLMYKNRYMNPYTGTNNNVPVKDEYIIPEDVTVVTEASIPATRKLIVPAHVEKILDCAFKYPQYVEEIIFEDPDNGALVQIGDDDIVEDAGSRGEYRANLSRAFLISYTQVKNFTLPKTVKKIAGPIIITTAMEVLDLSNYHPDYKLSESDKIKSYYSVSLGTSYENRQFGIIKELGSIEKLYINGDFTVELRSPDYSDSDYNAYNEKTDEHYTYSTSTELYTLIEQIFGEYSEKTFKQYIEYRGYSSATNLVHELIASALSEKFDMNSELFEKLSITIDVHDFADTYDRLKNSNAGKEFSLSLMENGQPKTMLTLFYNDEEGTVSDENTWLDIRDGESVCITEIEFGQTFICPITMFGDTKMVDGVKYYFAGWSFREDCSSVDVTHGDKVVNFFQNMYAVYLPASEGVQYIENDTGYTALLDGIDEDIIVIADKYNSKTVNTLQLGSYSCKRIIMPTSIGIADSSIVNAIARNQLFGFQSVSKFSDPIDYDWLNLEKLMTCNAFYEEDGLYFIRSYGSFRFMLIGADENLSGQVFIPNDCRIVAAKFGSGVTDIVMPNDNSSRLHTITYLQFDTIVRLNIPSSVTLINKICGTITKSLTIDSSEYALELGDKAFFFLNVDNVQLFEESFVPDYFMYIGSYFNRETKLFLSCGYEVLDRIHLDYTENMYFYSEEEPDFTNWDVADLKHWHFVKNEFVIWGNPYL